MTLLQEAEGRGQQYIHCTERCKIVVLLPNSELTKGNDKRYADVRTVHLQWKTMVGGLFNTFAAKHLKKPIPQCQAYFKDSRY